MAASAHKMVALCVMLIIVLSTAGQPAMAHLYDAAAPAPAPDRSGLACPSPVTTCRTQCALACNTFSQAMCDGICRITQSQALLSGLAQTCVNQVFTPCQAICKNLCEPLPVQKKTNP